MGGEADRGGAGEVVVWRRLYQKLCVEPAVVEFFLKLSTFDLNLWSPHRTVFMQHITAQSAQHGTAWHSTAHSTAQRSAAQYSAAQRTTVQYSTAQYSAAQHCTAAPPANKRDGEGEHTQADYRRKNKHKTRRKRRHMDTVRNEEQTQTVKGATF